MVDRDQRQVARQGDGLAGRKPHHHPAHQPRPRRRRHAVQRVETQPGLVHGAGDDGIDHLHMRPRRDLRHHAAVGRMIGDLAGDHRGQHGRFAGPHAHHGGGGLVAAGLDAQDGQVGVHCPL